jgi:hypothetical protein
MMTTQYSCLNSSNAAPHILCLQSVVITHRRNLTNLPLQVSTHKLQSPVQLLVTSSCHYPQMETIPFTLPVGKTQCNSLKTVLHKLTRVLSVTFISHCTLNSLSTVMLICQVCHDSETRSCRLPKCSNRVSTHKLARFISRYGSPTWRRNRHWSTARVPN